jgi:anaphase-promoting complex subunit 3
MNQEVQAIEFSLKFRIFDNALLLCEEYFDRAPSPRLLYLYAKTYLDSGSPVQAATLCKQHEDIVGTNAELRIIYAQALFESGSYAEADLCLKKIDPISLSSDHQAAILYLQGTIKLRTHRYSQATVDFASAIKQQPLLLSAIPLCAPDPSTSATESQAPRRTTPKQLRAPPPLKGPKRPTKSPPATSFTVSLLRNAANPVPIAKSFPIEFQHSIECLRTLACYHFRCAKYQEAARLFRRLYDLHPHTVRGVDTFSTVLWQLKDEKALNQLSRRAVALAPSRAETWIASGNLFSLQHNTDAAIQMFQRAASIDKSSSYSLALAGHELLLFDSLAEAAKLFRQSIDRNPSEWSAWYGIGSVHFRQDNFNAAEYYMKKALELNPSSSVLFYVYAMVLRKCDRDDEAQKMFDRALEIDPMNLVAAYQKALLLHEVGNLSGAIECLKKAASLVPHEPGVAMLRGKIAQSLGKLEEATSWYTDALIYGHPEKKDILWAVERMSEVLTRAVLEEEE